MSDVWRVAFLVLAYLHLGAVCVVWRAQNGRPNLEDGTAIAIVMLWPAWVLAYIARSYGWRHR